MPPEQRPHGVVSASGSSSGRRARRIVPTWERGWRRSPADLRLATAGLKNVRRSRGISGHQSVRRWRLSAQREVAFDAKGPEAVAEVEGEKSLLSASTTTTTLPPPASATGTSLSRTSRRRCLSPLRCLLGNGGRRGRRVSTPTRSGASVPGRVTEGRRHK
jgi:hypothetical protein